MKLVKMFFVVLILGFIISGCSDSHSHIGTYYNTEYQRYYIELQSNGEFEIFENASLVVGTYKIEDNVLTMTFESDGTTREIEATIEDGKIVSKEGGTYIRNDN